MWLKFFRETTQPQDNVAHWLIYGTSFIRLYSRQINKSELDEDWIDRDSLMLKILDYPIGKYDDDAEDFHEKIEADEKLFSEQISQEIFQAFQSEEVQQELRKKEQFSIVMSRHECGLDEPSELVLLWSTDRKLSLKKICRRVEKADKIAEKRLNL